MRTRADVVVITLRFRFVVLKTAVMDAVDYILHWLVLLARFAANGMQLPGGPKLSLKTYTDVVKVRRLGCIIGDVIFALNVTDRHEFLVWCTLAVAVLKGALESLHIAICLLYRLHKQGQRHNPVVPSQMQW
jgi:hypothetical protein